MNKGELNKYLIKDNHEAIISREIFEEVQTFRTQRATKNKPHSPRQHHPFKGITKCSICGSSYTRKRMRDKLVWVCSLSARQGQEVCNAKLVPDNIIVEASNHILSIDQYDDAYFKSKVKTIIVKPNKLLEFHMKDSTIINYHWEHQSRSKSWTLDMKEKARQRSILQHQGGIQDA